MKETIKKRSTLNPPVRGKDLVRWMRGKATVKLSTDEIITLTRDTKGIRSFPAK
jgi:hypothetical protein